MTNNANSSKAVNSASSNSNLALELSALQSGYAQLLQSYTQMAGTLGLSTSAQALPVSTVQPIYGQPASTNTVLQGSRLGSAAAATSNASLQDSSSAQSLQRSSRQIASAVRRALTQI